MARAGGTQRAKQLGGDAITALGELVAVEMMGKLRGSLHWAYGVRARWANANLKQVKGADRHTRLRWLAAPFSLLPLVRSRWSGIHEEHSAPA